MGRLESRLGTHKRGITEPEKERRMAAAINHSDASMSNSKSGPRKKSNAGPVKSSRKKDTHTS